MKRVAVALTMLASVLFGSAYAVTASTEWWEVPPTNKLGEVGKGAGFAVSNDLATVSYSGSYNDLSDKPAIPEAQVNSDWNANSGVAQILNKPDLTVYATKTEVTAVSNAMVEATTLNYALSEWTLNPSSVLGIGTIEIRRSGEGWVVTRTSGVVVSEVEGNALSTNLTFSVESKGDTYTVVATRGANFSAYMLGSDSEHIIASTNLATTSNAGLMSSDDKTKLNGLAAQVNADWNASSGVAQILNKPTIPKVYFGTCGTAASTRLKTITCPELTDADVTKGTVLYVKFTNAQTYNGAPQMVLNSTSSHTNLIYRVGTTGAARYEWVAGEVLCLVYDGTHWMLLDAGFATTSYYGVTKLIATATSTSTGMALTGSALNSLVQGMIEPYPVFSDKGIYQKGDRFRYNFNAWICTEAFTSNSWDSATNKVVMIPPIQDQIESISNALSAVAWSGSYNDLSNKPTNLSQFTNDSGYITGYTETDPTVGLTNSTIYVHGKSTNVVVRGKKNSVDLGTRKANTECGSYSVVEGENTAATVLAAHAEGYYSEALGQYSHAEGEVGRAIGQGSHAEGNSTTAGGRGSHAAGYMAVTAGSGSYSSISDPHNYAYAWQGSTTSSFYHSHGDGTYNINPAGGTDGFYIGETNFTQHIANLAPAPDLSGYAVSNQLNKVAYSGKYADLSGTPNLAAVATSGSYNDLSNKPTIPAAQVQTDWNATSGMGVILNKPTLATVATSGSYNDLSNKPTIPAVAFDGKTLTVNGISTNIVSSGANGGVAIGNVNNMAQGANSFAAGNSVMSLGNSSIVLGRNAIDAYFLAWTMTPLNNMFIWNGQESTISLNSQMEGGFVANPVGGINNFWIGSTNLAQHIRNLAPAPDMSEYVKTNSFISVSNKVAEIEEAIDELLGGGGGGGDEPVYGDKKVAMFIIDVNPRGSDGSTNSNVFTGFELKASTNNFAQGASDDVRLQFYSQSIFADTGLSNTADRMKLFQINHDAGHDNRSYTRIQNTQYLTAPQMVKLVAIVDVSCLVRHPEHSGRWLNEDNEQLVWCYMRDRNDSYDKIAGTDYPLWQPIAPVRWFKKVPDWAK